MKELKLCPNCDKFWTLFKKCIPCRRARFELKLHRLHSKAIKKGIRKKVHLLDKYRYRLKTIKKLKEGGHLQKKYKMRLD